MKPVDFFKKAADKVVGYFTSNKPHKLDIVELFDAGDIEEAVEKLKGEAKGANLDKVTPENLLALSHNYTVYRDVINKYTCRSYIMSKSGPDLKLLCIKSGEQAALSVEGAGEESK